jgi:hypothetical protein
MSRSGYGDDLTTWDLIRWRGQVASAIRGRRGQAFLRDLLEALDAMPEKRLITEELQQGGEVCALGAVGAKRGIDMTQLDPYDHEKLGVTFNIAFQLAQEIMYENDEVAYYETPEFRWKRMRAWVVKQLNQGPNHEQPRAG